MDMAFIEKLCSRIALPVHETRLALAELTEHPQKIEALAEKAKQSPDILAELVRQDPKNGLTCLCVVLFLCEELSLKYSAKGIAQQVMFDSLADIRIWCENYTAKTGLPGLGEIHWLFLTLNLKLFRLHRLQFELADFSLPEHYKSGQNNISLAPGDHVLNVHIPRLGPLVPQECADSFALAQTFFPRYFPAHQTKALVCDSWLLFPALLDLIPPDSNLARFQCLWAVKAVSTAHPDHVLRYIFGEDYAEHLHDLPARTQLQAAAKAVLDAGGKLGTGYGLLDIRH